MLRQITSAVFHAAVVLIAIPAAVWLTITGHTLQIEGLLLAMGAIFGAVLFGFRLTEGFGTGWNSIWVGPLGLPRPPDPALEQRVELPRAA